MGKRLFITTISTLLFINVSAFSDEVELGPRPLFLIGQMEESALKEKLHSCQSMEFRKTDFSIGHRGAPLEFPEHTLESYEAAARMGAGIVECDVTFTKDKELVCRHSQNDLHQTTNVLKTKLADQCTRRFSPAKDGKPASAECRTSDFELGEFKSLSGKMDGYNDQATDIESYLSGLAGRRADITTLHSGTVMSHKEMILSLKKRGIKFMPELKTPVVEMPFDGFSQEDFAQKLIDEYKDAGVLPSEVWPQSFNLSDIIYWIENEPEFGKQAVYLDSSFRRDEFDHNIPSTFEPSMRELKAMGVNYLAPPLWMLLTIENQKIVPSAYATEATSAGLKLIAWTLERSGSLDSGGGWYYQSIAEKIEDDGDIYEVLYVLAQDVGVVGVFSDWPATTTYFANCMKPSD